MKIYCSKSRQRELIDFIGQDIWVRCYANWGGIVYVKVDYLVPGDNFRDGAPRFCGNVIDYDKIHDEYGWYKRISIDDMEYELNKKHQFSCWYYTVVTPVDIMTTEEILSILREKYISEDEDEDDDDED